MPRRFPLIALIALVFTACDDYPADFPALDRGVIAVGCADISGTYLLDGPETQRNRVGFRESFLREIIATAPARWPWERITIAGDASDSLIVTAARSDSTAAGQREQLVLRPEETRVVHRGRDYECGDGWVRSARTVHDPGPDSRTPRPDAINGDVFIARTVEGGLVAKTVYSEAKELTLWCGDGCRGVPMGTPEVTNWARWDRSEPFVRAPATRSREAAPPALVSEESIAPQTVGPSVTGVEELIARASELTPDGVAITGQDSDGRGVVLSVTFTTQATLARYLRALADDPALGTPDLVGVRTAADGSGTATVRVQAGMKG